MARLGPANEGGVDEARWHSISVMTTSVLNDIHAVQSKVDCHPCHCDQRCLTKRSLRALPLFDIVPAIGHTHEVVLHWMHLEDTYVLVVGEHRHRLARGEILQVYGVRAPGNHLRATLLTLTLHIRNCRNVLTEHMNLRFCAHVSKAS